jgi:Outer membrane protein beta-barrel domain
MLNFMISLLRFRVYLDYLWKMKRAFIILSFLNYSISSLIAQDSLNLEKYYPKPRITAIEILLGTSSSTIRGISPSISNLGGGVYHNNTVMNKIGYSFGIGLVHNFNRHFDLRARLLWERKGVEEKTDSIAITPSSTVVGTGPLASYNTQNDYITISITPQLLLGKRSRFNIGIGGYFSILKESRITTEYFYPSPRSIYNAGNFDKYDYGLSLGAGYSFPLKKHLLLTIQFLDNYGLKQISNWHSNYFVLPQLHNHSYSLMIGIQFSNKKIKLKSI